MQERKQKDCTSILLAASIGANVILIFTIAIINSNLLNELVLIEPSAYEYPILEPLIVEVYNESEEIQIVEPVLSERELIDKYIYELSAQYQVDDKLIHSIVWHESRYDPDAVASNGVCLGLMQVCTTWHTSRAERLGVTDFKDIRGSLMLGIDYISELLQQTNGDVGLTLMLYNMNHKEAYALHSKGQLSTYATSVLLRAEELRQGVN